MHRLVLSAPIANFAEPDWLVLGLSGTERLPAAGDVADLPIVHDFDALSTNVDWVVVVHPELRGRFFESVPALSQELTGSAAATLLLAWRAAPEHEAKGDGRITSILCSAATFRKALEWAPKGPLRLRQLCFYVMDAIANDRVAVDRLVVRQLPLDQTPGSVPETACEAVAIMPHRGRVRHLGTALRYLRNGTQPPARIRVGLDVEDPCEYSALAERHPEIEFFVANPAPVGPYVIRQELATRSKEPVIVLHDSDDVSSTDRLQVLREEMQRTGCDFVGSHEIRVDEIEHEVAAIRFPLDVSAALRSGPGHSLLHATAMIGRSQFFGIGGLSTDQRVANDTQFLFRAYFGLKIRNADAFLYFRRRHERALTVHPSTCNAIPLRWNLDAAWRRDFGAIQRGEMRLENSSLRPKLRAEPFQFARFCGEKSVAASSHE